MDLAAAVLHRARGSAIDIVRRYHRLSITVESPIPDAPCLIVANHGFGGAVDLNVWATFAALDRETDRHVTALTHQFAWNVGLGRLFEKVGAVPASRRAATAALGRGEHVLVFPGGDREAAKPWGRRNDVEFHARSGFAWLAIEAGVPIVPIVTAGAGESLIVLSDGSGLPRRLGLGGFLHSDVLPTSISIPWGLSIGVVGLAPYLPLPTKLDTVIMPAVTVRLGEGREALAARVRDEMQATLTRLVEHRVPVLGRVGGTG